MVSCILLFFVATTAAFSGTSTTTSGVHSFSFPSASRPLTTTTTTRTTTRPALSPKPKQYKNHDFGGSLSSSRMTTTSLSMWQATAAAAATAKTTSTTVSSLSSWLPSISGTSKFAPLKVSLIAGLIGAASQHVLFRYLEFRRSRNSDDDDNNNNNEDKKVLSIYTAHSTVAMVFMILVSIVGLIGWIPPNSFAGVAATTTATLPGALHRIATPCNQAKWLSSVVCGMLLLWDLPTSFRVPKLRNNPISLIHHFIMALLAFMGANFLPMKYAFYYFGITELSSIPLVIYDQLDFQCDAILAAQGENDEVADSNVIVPAAQQNTIENKDQNQENESHHQLEILEINKGIMTIITAIAFTLVRVYSFSKMTLSHFIPDILKSGILQPENVLLKPIQKHIVKFMGVSSVAFTALQLYWFSVMILSVTGIGNNNNSDGNDTESENNEEETVLG